MRLYTSSKTHPLTMLIDIEVCLGGKLVKPHL